MNRPLVTVMVAALGLSAFALPTLDGVQSEMDKGHYARAEQMASEIVAARPGSARAHYVYAELLVRTGQIDRAAEEAAEARRIDPDLGFAPPSRYAAFARRLAEAQDAALPTATALRTGLLAR